MTEKIWFNDPAVLFSGDAWTRFVPTKSMTTAEALNAVVRFSIYFSVLLFLATSVSTYLVAIPAVLAATVVLYKLFPNGKVLETFKAAVSGKAYTYPTPDNPFMNPMLTEILDNPNRPDAAPITRKDVQTQIMRSFQHTSDLYMDTSDLFDQSTAIMPFFTIQSAKIPNDQDGFLKWLAKGLNDPDYSSAPLARNAKLVNEGYFPARGSYTNPPFPNTTSKPKGETPSHSAAAATGSSK
jgi:hypothetical protein